MNVLMTADTVGGVFTYALELAAALGRQGVHVALATQGRLLSDAQRADVRRVPELELFESAGRLEWMEEPWEDVARATAWLLELSALLRPDLVHLNSYAHAAAPFGAPVVVVAHSCVCSWFEAVRGAPPPASFDRYRHEVALGLAASDLVVAPTRAMLSALIRHHGPVRSARVIPNGRSAAPFQCHARKEELILCVGRLWDAAKNVALLDGIAAGLPWPVLLAGDEEHADPAHRAATPAARRARPLGHLSTDALASLYARAAIYALPARYEPFGLSALEAALAGCALVLGDIPSLREVWGGAAAFVDPGAPRALQAALQDLIEHAELRSAMGARARARALALSPDRMARAYLDAYRSVLARRGRDGDRPAP